MTKTLKIAKLENLGSDLQTSRSLSVTVLKDFNAKVNLANVNGERRYRNARGESATDPQAAMHVGGTDSILKCKRV